jgi:hypothetical protein
MTETFLPYLPIPAIRAAYAAGRGDELGSGKIDSAESSAALVANTFGLFLDRPADMPPLPHLSDCGCPALKVGLEQCCRFPWAGGEHPWLDVLVETGSHLIGIESKRYEPFRERETVDFSSAYRRGVWGDQMEPFVRVMERLSDGSLSYLHLDAEQLVKHAFGLRTEATRRGKTPARTEATRRKKTPALMYLYAQPKAWPDGPRNIGSRTGLTHRRGQILCAGGCLRRGFVCVLLIQGTAGGLCRVGAAGCSRSRSDDCEPVSHLSRSALKSLLPLELRQRAEVRPPKQWPARDRIRRTG